jgi:uncharacterized membrane protein
MLNLIKRFPRITTFFISIIGNILWILFNLAIKNISMYHEWNSVLLVNSFLSFIVLFTNFLYSKVKNKK